MVVLALAVEDLAARMAALDLDRGVSDRERVAQTMLEVAHDVLRIRERDVVDDHVTAEGQLL
jgi:hypothetical protein